VTEQVGDSVKSTTENSPLSCKQTCLILAQSFTTTPFQRPHVGPITNYRNMLSVLWLHFPNQGTSGVRMKMPAEPMLVEIE
jgi:hypothetical protein